VTYICCCYDPIDGGVGIVIVVCYYCIIEYLVLLLFMLIDCYCVVTIVDLFTY